MGIFDLNKFLSGYAPGSIKIIDMKEFRGTRIAIDATCLVFRMMSRSNRDSVSSFDIRLDPTSISDNYKRDSDWLKHVVDLGVFLASFGIVPIYVFDGNSVPDKDRTKEKRKQEKKKIVSRLREMEEKLSAIPITEREDKDIEELRQLKSNAIYVPKEQVDILKEVLYDLGFPVISAKGEAEKTCAMLAIEGQVSAVYSPDTDCIALGTPLTISNIDFRHKNVKAVIHDRVLEELQLSKDEFMDLCILGGCDFNQSLPGIRIKNAYKIYKKLPAGTPKTIENVLSHLRETANPPKDEDVQNLSYERCRSKEIFGYISSVETIQGDCPLEINHRSISDAELPEKLASLGIKNIYHSVRSAIQNVTVGVEHKGGAEKILREGRTVSSTPRVRFVLVSDQKITPQESSKIVITDLTSSENLFKRRPKKIFN